MLPSTFSRLHYVGPRNISSLHFASFSWCIKCLSLASKSNSITLAATSMACSDIVRSSNPCMPLQTSYTLTIYSYNAFGGSHEQTSHAASGLWTLSTIRLQRCCNPCVILLFINMDTKIFRNLNYRNSSLKPIVRTGIK